MMTSTSPSAAQRLETIKKGGPAAIEAGRVLLEGNPTLEELVAILTDVPELEAEAWKVVHHRLTVTALRHLIENGGKRLAARAADIWLQNPMSEEQLVYLMTQVRDVRVRVGRRLLSQHPGRKSLRAIVRTVPRLRKEAARRLLNDHPNARDLRTVIDYVDSMKVEAAHILMEASSDVDDLEFLFEKVPSLRKEISARIRILDPRGRGRLFGVEISDATAARGDQVLQLWEELLDLGPEARDLVYLVEHIPPLREKAGRLLLRAFTEPENLVHVLIAVPELRDEVWETFEKGDPSADTLLELMQHCPELRFKAWNILVEQNGSNRWLIELIRTVDDLREFAGTELLKRELSTTELLYIIRYDSTNGPKAAKRLMRARPTHHELRQIIVHASQSRKKAVRMLLADQPSLDDLRFLMRWAGDDLDEVASAMFSRDLSNQDLALIVAESSTHRRRAAEVLLGRTPTREQRILVHRYLPELEPGMKFANRREDVMKEIHRAYSARLQV